MDEANENRDPAGITALLQQIKQGDVTAESELMPLIYHQLRAIARDQLARERTTTACRQPSWCTMLFCSWWETHRLIGATGRISLPWHRARCAAC
jgi:hypothetical protein